MVLSLRLGPENLGDPQVLAALVLRLGLQGLSLPLLQVRLSVLLDLLHRLHLGDLFVLLDLPDLPPLVHQLDLAGRSRQLSQYHRLARLHRLAGRKCSGAELTVRVDEHWTTAGLIDPVYSGNECRRLARLVTDADGVSFASATLVPDIDIVVARGEILASK